MPQRSYKQDYGWYSNSLNVNNLSHLVVYRTIDGKKAKVVSPNEFGSGITGVYFDSLEVSKIWKFQMSGTDLSSGNQILLLKSIETLKFKE